MKNNTWLNKNTSSLTGKTVALTGATGGLGIEVCRCLAALGADLVLIGRSKQKTDALCAELTRDHPGVHITRVEADLADFASVRRAAQELRTMPIDYLIHNAGAYSIPRHTCTTGLDNVFQINFVSPYYLTRELLPTLRARHGRVVAVGSIAHNYSRSDPDDIDFSGHDRASRVYGNAKRYLMFALYELFRDEQEASLSVVHPGITFTNITAHYPPLIFALIKHPMKVIFMPPRIACRSIVRGLFEACGYHEWIGPRLFDIWGNPKKRTLTTCPPEESRAIHTRAERIYQALQE